MESRQGFVKAPRLLLVLSIQVSSAVIASTAYAADPFQPVNIPICSSPIRRGAQIALDNHMTKLLLKKQESDYTLQEKYQQQRDAGLSTAGIETQMRMNEATWKFNFQRTAADKIDELQSFAYKKYKCLVDLYYTPPVF